MLEKIALFFKSISDYMKSDLCLFKYFTDALTITNQNIILLSPLMFFIIFSNIYAFFISTNYSLSILISLILIFAMTAVFFSGWFYSVMVAVKDEEKDNPLYLLHILKQFPIGVGKYVIEFGFMIIIFFLLLALIIFFSYKAAYALIGSFGISRPELFFALSSPETMETLLKSLTLEQKIKLSQWNWFFIFTTTLYSFMIMFWAPEIIYKNKFVVHSLINSVVKLFKKFFKSLTIFSFLMILYFMINILSEVVRFRYTDFLFTIVYLYFLLYASVLIFLFYKREYVDNE